MSRSIADSIQRKVLAGSICGIAVVVLAVTCIVPASALAEEVDSSDSQSAAEEIDSSSTQNDIANVVVKIKSAKLVGNSCARISWKKVSKADGYLITYVNSKGKTTPLTKIDGTGVTYCHDYKAKAGKISCYAVFAYQNDSETGEPVYSESADVFKIKYGKKTFKMGKGDWKAGTVYGPSLNAKQRKQVKKAVTRFYNTYVTSDMTDAEKVCLAQSYLSLNCNYAKSWAKNGANTAWGALVYKKKGYHEAQCSGYARAFKALCDAMKVPCRYVHADAKALNPSHQWNIVKISGKWYIVDPQGNDTYDGTWPYFMCGSKTYPMSWKKSAYPKVSKTAYSSKKLTKAVFGYNVYEAQRHMINKK